MDSAAVARAAEAFGRARLHHQPLGQLPEDVRPRTIDDGYVVQDAVIDFLEGHGVGHGGRGYKVGMVSPKVRADYGGSEIVGVDTPLHGVVLNIYTSPTELAAEDFGALFVQGEFAVRMAANVPPRDMPYDREGIAEFVGECMAGIELLDWSLDYRALDSPIAPMILADDGANAGGVFGRGLADWRARDIPSLHALMEVDGHEVASGVGAELEGHPLDVLAWLAGDLVARSSPLRQDDYILLGGVTPTSTRLEPGSEAAVMWDALGEARVRLI